MLTLRQAAFQIWQESECTSVHDAWKIFLDWKFHACYSGCAVCKSSLNYVGDCFYERSYEFFDSASGRHVEAPDGGDRSDAIAAGSSSRVCGGDDGAAWWEAVIFER